MTNSAARVDRVWLAQTHLMEADWPFFFLVEKRPTLLKVDVSAAAGPVPHARVVARWPDGRSETLCLQPPNRLPTSTDMRPQPLSQDLASSYTASLPAAWLRAGLSLRVEVDGAPVVERTAAQLRVASAPELTLVVVNTLLFGDTEPRPLEDAASEFGSKLPVSTMRVATLPFDLKLPRLVIPPRSDGRTATGTLQATAALWADRKPSCTDADKATANCTLYGGFGVLAATINLADALQAANGMSETALWYANHGLKSNVGGGLGGGNTGSGDDLKLVFNHEMGHAMGLPHMGDVTGARQTDPTKLMHPYTGETTRGDGQMAGGGFGRTAAYDPIDHGVVQAVCAKTGLEQQSPMQRGCNTVRSGRRFDHFSDFESLKLLRYLNGTATVASGTVQYHSRLLAGSGPDAFQAVRYQLPKESGRTQLREQDGVWSLHRWSDLTQGYEQLLRPPGGDGAFLVDPPAAQIGQRYERYYDFRYPIAFDKPVFTVFGTFNFTDDATSTIYGVQSTRGHLMRLWDPTQPDQFEFIKRGASGDTFWWGYDLHLRVQYADGSVRYVAMPFEAKPTTSAMQGFTTWAVNLPDEGRAIAQVELLHRPLCSRNGAASDRSCDVNLTANDITPSNVYSKARVAAVWRAR